MSRDLTLTASILLGCIAAAIAIVGACWLTSYAIEVLAFWGAS